MAPELFYPQKFGLPDGRVSRQADIYAFGMVVYEVLTGRDPFGEGGCRHAEIIFRVVEGKRLSKPENGGSAGFGEGTWELVQQCQNKDQSKRLTIDKIRKYFHRIIEGRRPSKPEEAGDIGFGGGTWELVQQCWNEDRDKRPTVDKIHEHLRRVAATSKVVPPGPTLSVREAVSELDSSSCNFSQCLLHIKLPTPNLTS